MFLRVLNDFLKSLLIILMTAACIFKSHEIESNNIFESWGSTEIEIVKMRYTWTIKNFSYCIQQENDNNNNHNQIMSPEFSATSNYDCNWGLALTSNNYEYSDGYLSISIYPVNCNARAKYRIGFISANGTQTNVFNKSEYFLRHQHWESFRFIHRIDLLNLENDLLVNDQLTIFCEINATVGTKVTTGKFSSFPRPKWISNSVNKTQENLEDDLKYLYDSKIFSDVVLLAYSEKVRAHKAILAARSVTFKKILEQDVNATLIEVDLSPKVLNEILRYIYTEEVFNLKFLAPDLLIAAEMYNLIGLKSLCEKELVENITVDNAVQIFILGENYALTDIKNSATHFIISHAAAVAKTGMFKTMVQQYPHLIQEIFFSINNINQ